MASKVAGYIGKIEKNGDWVAIGSTAYGVCDTAANVAEKVVDMKGFELVTGATVYVKFVYGNTAQNPTVNINETGAKGIISADNSPVSAWLDGAVLALTFDGNNWATSGDPSGSAIDEAISTVSGSLITLTDATDAPVSDVVVAIDPVQAGSGDPSPTNVRAISGWDTCNVASTGHNMLPFVSSSSEEKNGITFESNGQGTYHIYGTSTAGTTFQYDFPETTIVPKNCYYHVNNSVSESNVTCGLRYNGTSVFNYGCSQISRIIDVSEHSGKKYNQIDFFVANGRTVNITLSPMILLTDTVTTYEPYQGQTVTIDLGGTRYGGTLNPITGVLTVDRAMVDLGTLAWTITTSGTYARFMSSDLVSMIEPPSKSNVVTTAICSQYKAISFDYAYAATIDKTFAITDAVSQARGRVNIVDDSYSDVETFKTAMSGVQLCYPLASPITYQLTPTEVRTLVGLNNIWADTGDITSLTYYKTAGKGIAEAVSNASANAKYDDGQTRSMITQSSETAMVATTNYTAGDLVIIGGQLLRATENIATTTELVIGEDGNVEVVDLETILKELSALIGALEE